MATVGRDGTSTEANYRRLAARRRQMMKASDSVELDHK